MLGSFFSILAGAGYFFGKCLNEAANRSVEERNYALSGRKERDRLFGLWTRSDVLPFERKELSKRAGRWPGGMSYLVKISSDHYNNFDAARKSDFEIAINQIALKEGWDYETSYRDALTLKGKYFIDFFGEEWRNKEYCTYKEVAQALNEETERREVWRKRCPRSDEVDVYPMQCEDEEDYHKRVKIALTRRWNHKYNYGELPEGLNAYDYEDEEDFLTEKERLDQYYGRYQTYRDVKISDRYYTSRDIDEIEKFVSLYDAKNITQDNIIEMFEYARYKIPGASRGYKLLKEKLDMLGYTISYDVPYKPGIYPAPYTNLMLLHSPKDFISSSEGNSSQTNPALPSPKSQEPSSITQSTKEQTPPNTKMNSNVHITATGKTYTMRRGNKKSKLTLTKRV